MSKINVEQTLEEVLDVLEAVPVNVVMEHTDLTAHELFTLVEKLRAIAEGGRCVDCKASRRWKLHCPVCG